MCVCFSSPSGVGVSFDPGSCISLTVDNLGVVSVKDGKDDVFTGLIEAVIGIGVNVIFLVAF